MKPLILALLLIQALSPQKPAPKVSLELLTLRDEFVKATEEYKASLAKLLVFYESDIRKCEDKLEVAKKLYAEGLVPHYQVEDNERQVKLAKEKLTETQRQIANADAQIKEVLDDSKLEAAYKRDMAQRRRERKRSCSRWIITSYYRETRRSIEGGFRFVCSK